MQIFFNFVLTRAFRLRGEFLCALCRWAVKRWKAHSRKTTTYGQFIKIPTRNILANVKSKWETEAFNSIFSFFCCCYCWNKIFLLCDIDGAARAMTSFMAGLTSANVFCNHEFHYTACFRTYKYTCMTATNSHIHTHRTPAEAIFNCPNFVYVRKHVIIAQASENKIKERKKRTDHFSIFFSMNEVSVIHTERESMRASERSAMFYCSAFFALNCASIRHVFRCAALTAKFIYSPFLFCFVLVRDLFDFVVAFFLFLLFYCNSSSVRSCMGARLLS